MLTCNEDENEGDQCERYEEKEKGLKKGFPEFLNFVL